MDITQNRELTDRRADNKTWRKELQQFHVYFEVEVGKSLEVRVASHWNCTRGYIYVGLGY